MGLNRNLHILLHRLLRLLYLRMLGEALSLTIATIKPVVKQERQIKEKLKSSTSMEFENQSFYRAVLISNLRMRNNLFDSV